MRAEAYLWIADLAASAERIGSGDFAHWLRETGRRPYSGG